MTKFIIASNNAGKVRELDRILNPLGIAAVTAKSEGISLDDVEETGTTFAENARLKARAAFEKTGMPCIADDSGLSVDFLGGAPGVYSARYAGENATDADRIAKLLKNLEGVSADKRTAHFICTICCIVDENTMIEVSGTCSGIIAFSPKGSGGFGYDPVFLMEDGRSFGELTADEKDRVSHRGNALRKLYAELEKTIG
ncbi:MAG: RdgB/HAM1 family non-canonical purine NTP pyrophosphatase [Clostridia bacterium]|nr:RdgB/HAM1 family non-canonical purine NTP pyrophosphatase [Clostridia bacterium]